MIILRFQGQVFEAKNLEHLPDPPPATEKRGLIRGFSKRSRSRMIDLMMRLNLDGVKVSFLTLTFSDCPPVEEGKKAFKRFIMRLRRKYPAVSAVWRMEWQKRGSMHFHLMLFNCPFWPQRLLQTVWQECTGEERSIVYIKLVSSHRQLINYVSKYIGKVETPPGIPSLENEPYQHALIPEKTGRIWGYINKDQLPVAEPVDLVLTDDQLGGYIWFAIRAMSRGRSGNYAYCAKAYTSEAEEMMLFALKHGATTVNNFIWNEKRRDKPRQWFGGTAVISSASVPLAVKEHEGSLVQTTFNLPQNPRGFGHTYLNGF